MPDSSNEPEWLTRKKRIDPKLKALGWDVVPYEEGKDLSSYSAHAIEEYPTENGPADYARVVDGQCQHVPSRNRYSPERAQDSLFKASRPCPKLGLDYEPAWELSELGSQGRAGYHLAIEPQIRKSLDFNGTF